MSKKAPKPKALPTPKEIKVNPVLAAQFAEKTKILMSRPKSKVPVTPMKFKK